jgi:hypothetical protein
VDGKTIRDHLGLLVTLINTEEGTPVAVAADVRRKGHGLKRTQALLAFARGQPPARHGDSRCAPLPGSNRPSCISLPSSNWPRHPPVSEVQG